MTKRSVALLLAVLLAACLTAQVAAGQAEKPSQPITVKMDGKSLNWEESPVIIDGRMMVTMQEFLTALGSKGWKKAAEMAKGTQETSGVQASPESDTWVSGELVWLELPALVINGSIHLPIQFVAESMGGVARWDAENQIVVIDIPGQPTPEKPPTENPISKLEHTIIHRGNSLYLIVKNPTDKPIRVTFPSGQAHDFALYDGQGKLVWRDSDGKVYTQAIREETISPGQRRVYQSELPASIPAGPYTVRAYFPPSRQVAAAKINVEKPNEASQLTFRLSFRPAGNGLANNHHRLAFEILNHTDKSLNIKYPKAVSYRIVVRDSQGKVVWDHSGQKWDGVLRETIPSGSARYHFIRVPDLTAGRYTAEAYFPPVGDKPVTQVSFTLK